MEQEPVFTMPLAERQQYGCWVRRGYPAVDKIHIEYQMENASDRSFLLQQAVVTAKDGCVDEELVKAAARELQDCRLFKRQRDGAYLFTRRDDLVPGEGEAEYLEELRLR